MTPSLMEDPGCALALDAGSFDLDVRAFEIKTVAIALGADNSLRQNTQGADRT